MSYPCCLARMFIVSRLIGTGFGTPFAVLPIGSKAIATALHFVSTRLLG